MKLKEISNILNEIQELVSKIEFVLQNYTYLKANNSTLVKIELESIKEEFESYLTVNFLNKDNKTIIRSLLYIKSQLKLERTKINNYHNFINISLSNKINKPTLEIWV